MILRSLLLLGVGAAIACASPAFAAGTTAAGKTETATTETETSRVAALETEPPKADETVIKKPKAKAAQKKATKKVAKNKKKQPVETEEAKEEKSRGLFASLFGGEIKQKDDAKAAKAKPVKTAAKTKKEQPKPVEEVEPIDVSISGNKGELRSENREQPGLFASLFGGSTQMAMLPETRALDSVLEKKQAKKKFRVKADFEPQEVEFTGYSPGTIVIDTSARYLYLVEDRSTARRYAIAVGREGLQFKGSVTVGDKQEWPRWIPTKEMQEREPKKYGQYKDGMDGGPENPLGARAIYLYLGRQDTHLRIHGTNQPQSIGTSASNGCFRMINDHVMDLYGRVKIGTPVVVL